MKKSHLLVAFASMFLLASCGEDFVVPEEETVVTGVVCGPTSLDLTVGEKAGVVNYRVNGTGTPSQEVTLKSENEGIATVAPLEDGSASFKVSPVSAGDTVITVTSVADESKAASVSVHVNPQKIIEVTPEIYSINADTQGFEIAMASAPKEIKVAVRGTENIDKSFTIVADNENVVLDKNEVTQPADLVADTLEGNFTVSANEVGTATIQVTSVADKKYTISIPVRVTDGGVLPPEDSVEFDAFMKNIAPEDEFDIAVTSSGTVTYTTEPADASAIFTYEVTDSGVHVIGVGDGEGKLIGTVGGATAVCNITVESIPTDVRSIYFTNNSALGYEEMYLHAWNDYGETLGDWPGVKLTDVHKNDRNEDCYLYEIDIYKYPHYILNNGKSGDEERKTPDCDFFTETDYNNIWFSDNAGVLTPNKATFTPLGPKVEFEAESVSVYEGKSLSISVTSQLGDVVYHVLSGDDYISVVESDNSHIQITGNAVGEATIEAVILEHDGYEEVSDTITINVLDGSGINTYYVTNNWKWEDLNVYIYGSGGDDKSAWPGDPLTEFAVNGDGDTIYKFDFDTNLYHSFIVSGKDVVGKGGEVRQTVDVAISSFPSGTNAIYFKGWEDESEQKVVVDYWTLTPSVNFDFVEKNVDVDGSINLELATLFCSNVTFSSNTPGVATVEKIDDNHLKVNGVSKGDAVISAKAVVEGTEYTDSFIIHVNDVHVHDYNATTHYCSCGELDPDYVKVSFTALECNTNPGEDIYICGTMCGWDTSKAIALSYSGGDWVGDVVLEIGTTYEYKLIKKNGSSVTWERSGEGATNRTLTPTGTTTSVTIHWDWWLE